MQRVTTFSGLLIPTNFKTLKSDGKEILCSSSLLFRVAKSPVSPTLARPRAKKTGQITAAASGPGETAESSFASAIDRHRQL